MTDRLISMYFYLRIHEDELSKTHRFKTYNNSLLMPEVLVVAIFGCNIISTTCLLGTPSFVHFLRSFCQCSQDILITTETARFEILTAVWLRKQVLWHVGLCRWVTGSWRFETSQPKSQRHFPADLNLHPSGSFFLPPVNQLHWSWAVISYII
jgi:hypothetical protein